MAGRNVSCQWTRLRPTNCEPNPPGYYVIYNNQQRTHLEYTLIRLDTCFPLGWIYIIHLQFRNGN